MDSLLQGLPNVIVYLDNILVKGVNEDHLRNLNRVMDRLGSARLTLKESKCVLMTVSVEYLGHVIDRNLSQEKLRAIQEAPEPHNITELKSFLGQLNYYAKFLPSLANVLFPLYRLLQKNVKWTWTNEQSNAFVKAK